MENTTLLRAVRKAIYETPLEPVESCALGQWLTIGFSGIFEMAESAQAELGKDVDKAGTPEPFQKLLERLFTASGLPVSAPGDRRQFPIFRDPKNDPATLESSTGKIAAHYELRELDDLIPSHNPLDQFKKREDYPEGVQERPYHSDSGEQDKVRRNAANLNPRYLLNTNPDAMSGPPVVSPSGVVLGGNSRTMSMQLAWAAYPDKAKEYRQMLIDTAENYGFAPSQVEGMKKPTLVRVVSQDMDLEGMAQMSRRFNEVTTQSLQLDAEGVSKSKLVSKDTVATLREDLQDFETLREYLGDAKSKALVEALLKDGVIEQVQLSRITRDDGLLNSEGKELVEATLRGLIIQDYDIVRKTPASIIDKIDRAIPALAQLKGRGADWDMSELVTRALSQMQKALAGGLDMKTLPGYFGQVPLVADADRAHKGVQLMALTLANATGKELAARFSAVVAQAAKTTSGMNMLVPGSAPEPDKVFADAFLRPLATVGNKSVGDFRPESNDRHKALEWAYHASRQHSVEAAVTRLEAIVTSGKATEEDKGQARERLKLLSGYSGTIAIYKPKLGDFFSYSPARDGKLMLRPEEEEAADNADKT